MLLTLTSATAPARDLGLLLRKHPDRLQTFALGFGNVHVFYPEASDDRCTAALLLDVDPIGLVRGKPGSAGEAGLLDAYVNDRPYVASSFMSVAIARVLGSALAGRSEPPALAARELALEVTITPVRSDGDGLETRLFAPLGLRVDAAAVAVPDAAKAGRHVALRISGTTTVRNMLSYLYVLVPVLDAEKHYWVGQEEVDKLFRHGGDWLAAHPERETIAQRYLQRAPKLAREAVARLAALDDAGVPEDETRIATSERDLVEKPLRLQDRRVAAVLDVLRASGANSVADLGCGDGDLVIALAREPRFTRILALDVAIRELERAKERLGRTPLPLSRREAVVLAQSSVLYADPRVADADAATLLEVIEHIDEARLPSLERAIFGAAHPKTVIVTTPNHEYNVLFPALANGAFRHPDHRFEWTRAQFGAWAQHAAERYGYGVTFAPVGEGHETLGAPTQMAVFRCA